MCLTLEIWECCKRGLKFEGFYEDLPKLMYVNYVALLGNMVNCFLNALRF